MADIHEETIPLASERQAKKRSFLSGLVHSTKLVITGSKLNLLLCSIPIAILFAVLDKDSAVFVFSLIGLVPLAERLGYVTEELSTYTNDTLGGLLNATFGNATELIICGVALYNAGSDHDRQYLRIVQLSLLGSVMGNLLLVLGSAFLVGGIANDIQSFNQEGMDVNNGMLFTAATSIILPSALRQTGTAENKGESELHLSRFESILMLILYASFLVFQLVTHKHLFAENLKKESIKKENVKKEEDGNVEEDHPEPRASGSAPVRSSSLGRKSESGEEMEENRLPGVHIIHRTRTMIKLEEHKGEELDVEDVELGLGWSVLWLGIITVIIAVLSEMVVDTIDKAHDSLGIPMPFLSTIVLPLVGNAAEHASAILFAYKDKMSITIGVAVGSSTQISMFVIPITVVLAWIMGQPLDLNFEWFEAFTLFMCVLITVIVVSSGNSNWIKGLLLITTYLFISATFWVHLDKHLKDD